MLKILAKGLKKFSNEVIQIFPHHFPYFRKNDFRIIIVRHEKFLWQK